MDPGIKVLNNLLNLKNSLHADLIYLVIEKITTELTELSCDDATVVLSYCFII